MTAHVVVPYAATNSTVRARCLHWVGRAEAAGVIEAGQVTVHGPGFAAGAVPDGEPLLLLRNARRITRGRGEARLLQRASPGVYDLDDGLPWDDGNLDGLGHWTKRPFPRSLVARRAAQSADRVVVGNSVLADWAADHNRDVRIVPTCVEPSEYKIRTSWEMADVPVLGWIGSQATEGYLVDIAPALAEINARTGARLRLVSGAGPLPVELAPFADKIEWSLDSTQLIAGWDIGLMPLRDGEYERAKCGYKLLQYAASGVPMIGSPVGANREILDNGDGVAPTGLGEWVDAICDVLAEPASRRQQRAMAGLTVAARYSYAAWQEEFLDAVEWDR